MDSNTLESAGYKEHLSCKEGTKLFIKRICDDVGEKYPIAIYEWDWSYFRSYNISNSYEVDVRLYRENMDFNIVIHVQSETLEEIEKLIDDVWIKLGCEYLHN